MIKLENLDDENLLHCVLVSNVRYKLHQNIISKTSWFIKQLLNDRFFVSMNSQGIYQFKNRLDRSLNNYG